MARTILAFTGIKLYSSDVIIISTAFDFELWRIGKVEREYERFIYYGAGHRFCVLASCRRGLRLATFTSKYFHIV